MDIDYTVSKMTGSNRWYAHRIENNGCPSAPYGRNLYGTKKYALHNAAMLCKVSFEDYMTYWRNKKKD